MSKVYLVFGDKCFIFVLARPLEHKYMYLKHVYELYRHMILQKTSIADCVPVDMLDKDCAYRMRKHV